MTKSAKDYLESEVNRIVGQARAITRTAEDENRGLNDEERKSVEKLIDESNGLKGRLADIEDNEKLMDALETGGIDRGTPTVAPEATSMGDAFVRSDGYKNLMARGLKGNAWSTGPVEFGNEYGRKLTDAGLSVVSIAGAGGSLPLQPQVAPMLGPVEDKLTIASLLGQGTATQNSIVYLEETSTTTLLGGQPYSGMSSAASTTAEGAAKPVVFVDFTKRSASVEKIAAFLPIADEMLEDEPQISSYINSRLVLFVRQAEEAYVFSKIYTGAMSQADASTDIGGSNLFDAVAAGILKVSTAGGLDADAVLIHPVDFWTMATTKSASSGDYFSGGPYASPARSPWGITAVITREAPQGAPVVGAFRDGATLWRKGGLTVEASNSHSDYFRKDLTALRAEERIAVTVQRPKAFAKCVI